MFKHMHKRAKGNIGEDIAVSFLEKKGFHIKDRNYLKKWGELDIVAMKLGMIHFFEVKSVTREMFHNNKDHNPEDNVHGLKVKHLRRIIETYLEEKTGRIDMEFQFHVLCIFMNLDTRTARVKWLENIIL